jgi:NAD(P)-dependent dehydrogenase (short-subunit alcohol dehydrogenase family)
VPVSNVGHGSYGAVEDVPMDDARRRREVNVFGAARLTQLVLPHLRGPGDDHRPQDARPGHPHADLSPRTIDFTALRW